MILKPETIVAGIIGGFSLLSAWPLMKQVGYDTKNAIVNVVALSYSLYKHYWGNLSGIKPAAVVAGIPLPSVDELSHGISDREVRYRANGGVFLAHQSGGNESLRIVGRAWGSKRFLFLIMLDLLFLWGSDKTVDVFKKATTWNKFLQVARPLKMAESGKAAERLEEIDRNPWKKFNEENLNEGTQEQHMTFPVITKNRVYVSMFIETYSWRQRLDTEGRKMVEYTLFFRKYDPLPEIDFGMFEVQKKRPKRVEQVKVYKEREVHRPMINAVWKSLIEITATLSINPELFEVSNYTNFGYQFMLNYWGVNKDNEDRIPGIIEQRGFF